MAFDVDKRRLLPECSGRRKDRYGRGGIFESWGLGGNVGSDHVLVVLIDGVAATEFQENLARDITRGSGLPRIGETDVSPSSRCGLHTNLHETVAAAESWGLSHD